MARTGQRIRYKKHKWKENRMISVNTFTSTRGAKYKVVLDLEEMKFYIRNERTKEYVIKSNVYTNMNAMKYAARKRLTKLGITLKKEIRDRTFGLCEKGQTQIKHELKAKENKDEN